LGTIYEGRRTFENFSTDKSSIFLVEKRSEALLPCIHPNGSWLYPL